MKISIPSPISSIINNVPHEELPKGEEESKLWYAVAYELSEMLREAASLNNPEIVFNDLRQTGSQYIWEFYVNELSLPVKNEMNWHGQNISQWRYAGAILLQHGRVSTHH